MRIGDLHDVAFDFNAADIGEPLPRQHVAGGLHDQTGIQRAAFSGCEVEIAHHPAAFVRPWQDPESAKVGDRQHVPAAAHGIAPETAVAGKDVLENVVGGIHGEQRGGERHAVPRRLREQARLDRSHPDDAVRVHEADPNDLQLRFVDRCEDSLQHVLPLG